MKKILLIVSGGVLLFTSVLTLLNYTNNYYVDDYFSAIGLSNRSFESLVGTFGEPIAIIRQDDSRFLTLQYDGIEFVAMMLEHPSTYVSISVVTAIRIFDSSNRFGRREIGVGSSRAEINRAFRFRVGPFWGSSKERFVRIPFGEDGSGLFIRDGFTWLYFYFDESDLVEKIVIYEGGP